MLRGRLPRWRVSPVSPVRHPRIPYYLQAIQSGSPPHLPARPHRHSAPQLRTASATTPRRWQWVHVAVAAAWIHGLAYTCNVMVSRDAE